MYTISFSVDKLAQFHRRTKNESSEKKWLACLHADNMRCAGGATSDRVLSMNKGISLLWVQFGKPLLHLFHERSFRFS